MKLKNKFTKITQYFLLLSYAFSLSLAQAPDTLWTRTYGGDREDIGYSVQETADGGYIIVGSTRSFGPGTPSYPNVYIVKTDASGDTLWTKTYGRDYYDHGRSIIQAFDGGYVVAGFTYSFPPWESDVYLIRTDTNGDTLWIKRYGGDKIDRSYSIQETSDSGYILTGYTYSPPADCCDVYLIKTDNDGDSLWTMVYGGSNVDRGYSVRQTSDGGYIIVGETWSFGAGFIDVFLIKTDVNGDTLWTRTYGGTDVDRGYSVQQTSDGGYIIVGETWSFVPDRNDVWLIKTDANGDTLWTKTYGDLNDDVGYSVQQTCDEGYIIAGYTRDYTTSDYYAYLIRVDSLGDTIWTEKYGYGGLNDAWSYDVKQTPDGGYVLVGRITGISDPWGDVYLIKIAPDTLSIEEKSFINQILMPINVFPNPFSKMTNIRFSLEQSAKSIELKIYDATGRVIKDIPHLTLDALRPTQISWDGTNHANQRLPSGVYFLKFKAGDYEETKKLLLLR